MTNAYDSTRGNTTDRSRRKLYLLETYRANVDLEGVPACRCYRCGCLLTYETLTVDRIVPGCKGGTYRRSNIRPSCSACATETGNELKAEQGQSPVGKRSKPGRHHETRCPMSAGLVTTGCACGINA